MQCHVAVGFGNNPPLHYHAEMGAARNFAEAIRKVGVATVRIDHDMREALRPLPCQRLWGV